MADRRRESRNAISEPNDDVISQFGLTRPPPQTSFTIPDMNPFLSTPSIPCHRILLVPAQGIRRFSNATLDLAFPYLPTASYLAIQYRIAGIHRMVDKISEWVDLHIQLQRQASLAIGETDLEARTVAARVVYEYSTRIGVFFDYARETIADDVETLRAAEEIRVVRDTTRLRGSWFGVGWSPADHARRTRHRLRDIGVLINELVPRTLDEVHYREPILFAGKLIQPSLVSLFFLMTQLRGLTRRTPVRMFEGIEALRGTLIDHIGLENYAEVGVYDRVAAGEEAEDDDEWPEWA